jgi:hypothetical protein
MFDVDLSTDWSAGMVEVWKGQTKALIPLLIGSSLFAVIAYLINSDFWALGAAVAALLLATFIMMSVTVGFWIIFSRVWSKYIPEKYHVTERLKDHPMKVRTSSVSFFTILFFILIYYVSSLSSDASIVVGAGGDPISIGLRGVMYTILAILGVLLALMWKKHMNIVRAFRDPEVLDDEESDNGSE